MSDATEDFFLFFFFPVHCQTSLVFSWKHIDADILPNDKRSEFLNKRLGWVKLVKTAEQFLNNSY
jgi:hypothetical protein